MNAVTFSVPDLNAMDEQKFLSIFGSLFEHSPWIALETWPQRPFSSRNDLMGKLARTMRKSGTQKQIKLIQAHPDLSGSLDRLKHLTLDSQQEQRSVGLDTLTATEIQVLEAYNEKYKEKFSFPFVVCARLTDKRNIILALKRRLELSREEEIQTALDEIEKIATLRLALILHA